MTRDFSIRLETDADMDAINDVHREAFEGDAQIQDLIVRLRQLDAPLATISVVAESAKNEVIGHVMLSHDRLDAPQR